MPPLTPTSAAPTFDPSLIAAAWFAHFAVASVAAMPREEALPEQPLAVIAAFAAIALAHGRTLVILAPDDQELPELSNALDLAIRPLCLVLPAADFAARIAMRATLALMKSRLARETGDEQSGPWHQQRERIAQNEALWLEAHQWVSRNDRSDWPERVADLFPARILPIAAYRGLKQRDADITLLYRCDAPPEMLVPQGSLLHVGAPEHAARSWSVTLADPEQRLRLELEQLTRDVADLELELATAQAETAEFTRRYYELVGRRMVELDVLQARYARARAERTPDDPAICAEAREKQERASQSAHERERFSAADAAEPPSFRHGNAVKRLFRQLAQKIHPDRATDEADRAWRTHLMAEANRAYRAGDEATLIELSALWQEGVRERANTECSEGKIAVSPSPTLMRQVEAMRARLLGIERELQMLFGSRLYELFIAARQARRQGRDLLAEMAEKLDENIRQLIWQLSPEN